MALLTPPRTPIDGGRSRSAKKSPTSRLRRRTSPSPLLRKRVRWDPILEDNSVQQHKTKVKTSPEPLRSVKDVPVSPPKAPRNHELFTNLQAELEKERKARHQAEVSCSGERETRLAIEKQLQTETRSYLEAKLAGEKVQNVLATAEALLEKEKQTRADFEEQVATLRLSETSLKKQVYDAQAWLAQASTYCTTAKEQAEAAVALEVENRTRAERSLEESLTDKRRLEELLEKEKTECDRLIQMLEIETLGRARIEELLVTRKSEEQALAEARSANAALEGEIARLQEELHSERALSLNLHKTLAEERARSEHLNILLKQFRDECATPFVVPAIIDAFALVASITDDVLEAPRARH